MNTKLNSSSFGYTDEMFAKKLEEQQAKYDERVANIRKEIMDQLRQSPSTWTTDQNYHALSVEALFDEEDILQFIAKYLNETGGKEAILEHVLKIFKNAVEDHLDEYLGDMK